MAFHWRMMAAAVVVALVAAVVWVGGRSGTTAAPVGVVVTVEEWAPGSQGAWVTVPVPEGVSGLLVRPEDLEGRVAAVRLPDGVIVPSGLLADPADVALVDVEPDEADEGSGVGLTRWSLGVDASLWPPPGPTAGDMAVFATERGGCAVAVLPLREASGGSVVLDVGQHLGRLLLEAPLSIWPAPTEGSWPVCDEAEEPGEGDEEGEQSDPDLGWQAEGG